MEHRFTAGELSKLSGLSKQTILFYDKKGILKPEYVDPDNGYRYYSADQLDLLDNISMLKEIGLSLGQIRAFMETRNRDSTLQLLEEQLGQIGKKVRHLQDVERQLAWKAATLKDYSLQKEGVFFKRHEKPELLAVQPVLYPRQRKGTDAEDLMAQNIAIKRLMTLAKEKQFPYLYQQGSILPMEEIQAGHFLRASYVFLPLEKRFSQADTKLKPAGLYAHCYFTGRYTGTGEAYGLILEELAARNLAPAGEAYEHCVLDSLTTAQTDQYVTLLQVQAVSPGGRLP